MLIKDLSNEKQSFSLDSEDCFLQGSEAVIVSKRDILEKIIDLPCLAACQYLYDCNIRTTGSSANYQNVTDFGTIEIDYNSLDEENKKIYYQLVETGILEKKDLKIGRNNTYDFSLKVPINNNTTIDEFSEKMYKLAQFFQPQDILYGRYSTDEMIEKLSLLLEKNGYTLSGNTIYEYVSNMVTKGVLKVDSSGIIDQTSLIEQLPTVNNDVFGYYHDGCEYWLDKSLYLKHDDFIHNKDDLTAVKNSR